MPRVFGGEIRTRTPLEKSYECINIIIHGEFAVTLVCGRLN